MGFLPKHEISPRTSIREQGEGQRYEALLRISEALSACREPEDLTRILSEQLREFLDFFQFYIIVYKENSTEVEWAVVGSEKNLISAYADVPVLQLSAGLDSSKCIEAYRRMREIVNELRQDGPTPQELERSRAYAAGARAIAFENTGAVARYGAQQAVVYGEDVDPDGAIQRLDEVTPAQVREVAAGISEDLAVACVGPHAVKEFESA